MNARAVAGGGLLALAAFMLLGFSMNPMPLNPATLIALGVGVALPAGLGARMIWDSGARRRRIAERTETLRRQALDSDLMRLAGEHGGRLTIAEVMRDLGVGDEEARAALEGLHLRGLVELDMTPSGGLVYRFPEVMLLQEKSEARDLLDA